MTFTLSDIEKLRKRGLQIKGLDAPKKQKEVTRKLVIFGAYHNINDVVKLVGNPKGASIYANMKRKAENAIVLQLANIAPIPGKNKLHFTWFCKDRKQDPPNICAGGRKFICDALQTAGIIENDGWKNIDGFSDSFIIDKEKPRVEVIFEKR